MKLAANRIEGFIKAPDASARAILVYGPDSGLVKERIDRMAVGVVKDLSDPFRISDIPASALKDDPARLADEAAAIPLTGGRRVVRVRDAADGATSAISGFLAHPMGDSLVLIEAGELGPRSSLRKLFEAADNAVALPCYADEGGGLEAVIHESLRANGLTAEPDAVAFLADHLGGDRKLTRSELEKLALYMGGPGRVHVEDAIACVGDTAALSMDDLALATADGDHLTAQRVLDRLFSEGTSPIPILRALQRHFQRLHLLAGLINKGKSADQALASLRPPAHFRVAARLRAQLQTWPAERLGSALDLIVTAEIDCKTTGMPTNEICSRAVMQLARAAARRPPARR
ncbi:MAG TPA: DNA polymerase III subunit delta [Patescibacteria group bacterium]|nr:DNA polymerase III subunit delta [Patescibacteria group bacterium]